MKLYQITPEKLSLMMCFVIKTDNNRIIVIDGGRDGTGKDFPPYLQSAIRAVLGIGQNDYFEVDAWFLTHAHTDHIYELAKMLKEYSASSNYKINNIYFDFPPIREGWESKGGPGDYSDMAVEAFKEGLINYGKVNGIENYSYDTLNGSVINKDTIEKGLTITVDGVNFEILQTWSFEDKVVNSTSINFKMTYKGKSVLFLGDAYIDSADRLLATYGAEKLKSDYVQLGHHGQSGPSKEFYLAIGADKSKRIWPSPYWVWECVVPAIHCNDTRSWLGLPFDNKEFEAKGMQYTGNDFVTGLYENFPADAAKTEDWTDKILTEQTVLEI